MAELKYPWFEILDETEKVIHRFKAVLNDDIEIGQELMSVPETELELPVEYLGYLQGRKDIRIHFNDGLVFRGMVQGIDTDKSEETITVSLSHVLERWNFRSVPTNKAIKNKAIPEVLSDKDIIYPENWEITFDDVAKKEKVDYVYSRQTKLEALDKTMELTPDLWYRVSLQKDKKLEVGTFGKQCGYILSTKSPTKKNIQIIEEPQIEEDYSGVVNLATVYSEKNDGGVTSLSLREVYNDPKLQDPKFPVVIIRNDINNERQYNYKSEPKIAPNTQLEYAVIDTESVAMEGGYFIESTFAFNDLSPFTLETESNSSSGGSTDTGKWIIPKKQRFLNESEMMNNFHCIYRYFKGKWSDLAIAAMCGAISLESTGNPNIWQNLDPTPDSDYMGFGLVGWTPYWRITNWLKKGGYKLEEYGVAECKKIEEEWMGNAGEWIPTSAYPDTFKSWSKRTDASMDYMVMAWMKNYGRGDERLDLKYPQRIENGKKIYQKLINEWKKQESGVTVEETAVTTTTPAQPSGNGSWNPDNFVNKYKGKGVDIDGFPSYQPYQCTDLWQKHCQEINGYIGILVGPYGGWAGDIWYMDYSKTHTKVQPSQTAQKGDWAIWGKGPETPYTHVAMVMKDNGSSITVFGQNQPNPYCDIREISKSGLLGYWRVKGSNWTNTTQETTTTVYIKNNRDGTKKALTDEDRILASKMAYQETIKKLKNLRRTYAVNVTTTTLPPDVNVGDAIPLMYSNSIFKLEHCTNYMRKILVMNKIFYITEMTRTIHEDGTETGELKLEKFIRIDRSVNP